MFNVEYSYDNTPQEGQYGVVSKDFSSLDKAYSYAAKVLARAAERNRNSPLYGGRPEDHFRIDLRITRQSHDGQRLPDWQVTLLTVFYDGFEEHAMWYSANGQVCHC